MKADLMYRQYEGFIKNRALSVCRHFGMIRMFEDFFQEASIAFISSLKYYQPDKGDVSTFCWKVISRHLTKYAMKEIKHSYEDLANYSCCWGVVSLDDGDVVLDDFLNTLYGDERVLVLETLHQYIRKQKDLVAWMKAKHSWTRHYSLQMIGSVRCKYKEFAPMRK